MSSAPVATSSYDDLVYPSYSFSQTHPDLLGTLGTMFGVEAATVDQCRVLELGCASGGNLIPLAYSWPGSQFLGIDYSARQIEIGKKQIEALGLKNIELRHASILEVDEGYGEFDYIISHGVYSWVPEEVQNGIMQVCRRNLRPNGIGYISYNTLPGWHMRGMIREMMCYHDTWHQKRPPLERVGQARALLQFLRNACRVEKSPYGMLLQQELELLQKVSDNYIYHEHLEEHNEPLYFFEFNERLVKHNLRFLGEADFRAMIHENLPAEIREQLATLAPNLIQMEQYLDFINNRTFRQSLICHEELRPSYNLSGESIAKFFIVTSLRPEKPDPDLRPNVQASFVADNGVSIQCSEPIVKAAVACLAARRPRPTSFGELLQLARTKLGRKNDNPEEEALDRHQLSTNLLQMYSIGGMALLEFWRTYPEFAHQAGEKPIASPLVRMMAKQGVQVTGMKHNTLSVGDFDRQILPHLDGTLTRTTLRNRLLEGVKSGELNLARNGQPIRDEHQARPILNDAIEQQFKKYADSGLLIG